MKRFLAKIWKALKLPTNLQLFLMRKTQDEFLVGVTGIFFDKKNRVLLFKHTYRSPAWSLPGGYIKKGEHPKEALEREVMEESGLIVSADQRIKIRTDRDSARLDITYAGVFIGGVFEPSHEVSKYKLFAFDKLPGISQDQLIFIEKAMNILKHYDINRQSLLQ